MHKRVTFRGMEHSKVIEDHVYRYLAKIEHFLQNEPEPIYLEVTLDAQRTHHHHMAECILKTPHYDLFTKAEGHDMYVVISQVLDTMERDLAEKKRQLIDERKHGANTRE